MQVVFFDLDETLCDHQYACRQGIQALAALHPELEARTVEELENDFWHRLNGSYGQVLSGAVTLNDTRLERIAALFKLCHAEPPEAVALETLSKHYVSHYDRSLRAIPGTIEVLQLLKRQGAFIGVITNGFTSIQRKKLEACGLTSFIDQVLTSQDVGVPKPHPAIFHAALECCKARPDQAIMIGDSWSNDIEGACTSGIRSIWLNRRKEPCPDRSIAEVIYTPSELIDLLHLNRRQP